MTIYTIHESMRPLSEADLEPQAVPERFSWTAALLPPLFALAFGLVLFPLVWLVGLAIAVGIGVFAGPAAGVLSYLLLALFLGFEAMSFRRGKLDRRGRIWRGDVVAASDELALYAWLAGPGKRSRGQE